MILMDFVTQSYMFPVRLRKSKCRLDHSVTRYNCTLLFFRYSNVLDISRNLEIKFKFFSQTTIVKAK